MSESESQQLRAPLPETSKKKRNWPRRFRILVLLLLLMAIASRAIIVLLLPPVLQRVAGYYGMEASYQRLELSVLGGDTGIWNLAIGPKGASKPLMTVDYCRGDISVLNLLRGRLAVWRAEADGVNFDIDRNADGTVPLLKLISDNSVTSATPTPAAKIAAQPRPLNFSSPLRIDALRLTHIRAHFRDRAVTPPLDTTVSVDLRLSDLGGNWNAKPTDSVITPTKFSADIDADPILDAMHVTGTGQFDGQSVVASFKTSLNGLRLRPLAPYLALLGVKPLANETSMTAGGELRIAPSQADPSIAAATIKLHEVSLIADGEEAAGLDELSLDAPSLDPHRLGLKQLSLQNVRLSGRRAADGNVRFAGLEYVGIPAAATAAPPTTHTPMAMPILDLPIVDINNLSAHLIDDAMTPPADFHLKVDDLTVKQILLDPAHPDTPIAISGLAHAPGIAGNIRLDGSAQPMASSKTFSLNINADSVELSAIKSYLAAVGVTSSIRNGSFTASINADASQQNDRVTANASLTNLKLADGPDLFAMDHATIHQAVLSLNPLAIKVDDISVAGPTLAVAHGADGSISAAGFRFDPKSIPIHAPAASVATTRQGSRTAPSSLPAFAVNHFLWNGINVAVHDDTVTPPIDTRVADAAIEWKDAALHVSASVPRIIEKLSIDGRILPANALMTGRMTLSASGINSTIAAPFLAPFHVEPTLKRGAIDATVEASLNQLQVPLDGSLSISDVRYRDGEIELAGVDRFAIDRFSIASPTAMTVGAIEVLHPRAVAIREKDGSFDAGGLHVLLAAFDGSSAPVGQRGASSAPTTEPAATRAAPPDVRLNHLHLDRGELRLIDQLKSTDTTASTTLDLDQAVLGEWASLKMTAAVSGVIGVSSIDGKIRLHPSAPAADLTVHAQHIRAGQLAAYLPSGLTVPLLDGDLQARVQAAINPVKSGGNSIDLVAGPLDYRETGAAQPYLKFESARVSASRIDPASGRFDLGELSTDGIELTATRTARGGIQAMGIDLETPQATSAASTTEATSETRPAESVQSLVARGHQSLPDLRLEKLNINLRRITLIDQQRPAAAPLVISDLRLRNLDPLDWGGPDPDSKPPTHFRTDFTIDPAIGLITVTAAANPLMSQPTLGFDVLASGINGNGITSLVPEIKPMINGRELVDGQFHLHGDAALRFSRRGDSQIDFADPLDADIDLKPIHFRAAANGPILAGVDEIHSDGIHVEPKSGAVHVKSLEITKPIGRVSREKDGIHVLGIVFNPPAAEVPSTEPTTAPQVAPLANPSTAPAMRPARPAAEIRVDQLVMNDLDFVGEDRTVDPPLIVPLNGLDVEVRDFTNMAPYEDRPLKFSALVNAAKVPLPRKAGSGGAATQPTEMRELFAQASANGSIGLFPAPNGYIRTALGGFELGSLTSEAAQYKVKLSDGVFDSSVDAKLPGDGSIQTKAKFVFTDLVLSEPPGGPIGRFLHLGAPLDVVVGALQDPDGSITVPLDFPVKNNELSPMALAGPAVGAFASIATTAVASAPIKAAGAIGDMFGLGGKKEQAPEPAVVLQFDPGDTTLASADSAAAMGAIKTRLIKEPSLTLVIKHSLGGGDLKDAQQRSNPSIEEAAALTNQLRSQQFASAQLRSELAGVARSEIERGTASADTLAKLKQVDQQMAQTDDAMDRLYDLLRPGADRMASRRTRATCLSYGKDRLAAVQSALLDRVPADVAERVHVLTPQYAEPAGDAGGTVVVQLVPKKK